MPINTEQFVAANKAAVDSLLAVANTALASAERITALNLNAARGALNNTVAGAQAVLAAKDPQEALKLQSSLLQPSIEQTADYSRSVYEISLQTQQELTKLFADQFSGFQKTFATLYAQAGKVTPAGYEDALGIQNTIAAVTSAFGNFNIIGKQFADAAQANLAAVTKAATKK
jgi:phasin family protein